MTPQLRLSLSSLLFFLYFSLVKSGFICLPSSSSVPLHDLQLGLMWLVVD
jgi:hypothetical protein